MDNETWRRRGYAGGKEPRFNLRTLTLRGGNFGLVLWRARRETKRRSKREGKVLMVHDFELNPGWAVEYIGYWADA